MSELPVQTNIKIKSNSKTSPSPNTSLEKPSEGSQVYHYEAFPIKFVPTRA